MYLKSIRIENYRKYGSTNNIVYFSGRLNHDQGNVLNSTLIVGQNNAGKTSIIKALEESISNRSDLNADDFNYYYLRGLINLFFKKKDLIEKIINEEDVDADSRKKILDSLIPYIKFSYEIVVDSKNNDSDELLTFVAPLIKNEICEDGIIKFYSKYEITEEIEYLNTFWDFIKDYKEENFVFNEYLGFLKKCELFKYNVYLDEDCKERIDFDIKKLISFNSVSYENLHSEKRLSNAFNKIYNFKVKNDPHFKDDAERFIKSINEHLDNDHFLKTGLVENTNKVIEKIIDSDKASMNLLSDLTIDKLLANAFRYMYKVGDFDIPEDQFGMGYTSMMLILAELIDHIDNSQPSEFKNKINLLVIEEPESYMHPQLQALFIKNINDAVNEILKTKENKKINCQLIITSHSPHVVKGKLDVENTFDNINYLAGSAEYGKIIKLDDESVRPNNTDDFNFLKRHISFASCELFFADACIAVEGFSEETIIPYYLSNDDQLMKKYISLFTINGAFSHIYKKLFSLLSIPVVIVTDLDPKKNDTEEEQQVTTLDGLNSANKSLQLFGIDFGNTFTNEEDNIFITTQNKINGFYPSSFEEAYILSNYENDILHKILTELLPLIYKEKIDNDNKYESLRDNSHIIQIKLQGKKGNFATKVLYNLINNKSNLKLPNYIQSGFDFIKRKLEMSEISDNDGE